MRHTKRFSSLAHARTKSACAAWWVLVVALWAPFCTAAGQDAAPRNVILMISDGCGFNHILATDYYQDGEAGQQRYEQTFTALAMSTYPAGRSYEPEKVHADFKACMQGATDSAAAATAMATGVKTNKGALGVDVDNNPVPNVSEAAEARGKATGVITTVPLSHATPAGFVAHIQSRGSYEEIALQMLRESAADVVMGAGHPLFDNDGKPVETEGGEPVDAGRYRYVGGVETWDALSKGEPMADADGDGSPDAWTLVQTRAELQALAQAPPKRVVALLPAHSTAHADRAAIDADVKDDAPYEAPRAASVPTLAEMAQGALAVLGQDPDGFFLMIEGGAVDWTSHGNQLGRMIEEQIDFHQAIDAVIDWVEAHGGWDENLVIVTADHECGYLCGPGSETACTPVKGRGKGVMPEAEWHSRGHTNQLVPFYVRGAGSARFTEKATRTDPVHGAYLDNTDLAKALFEFFKSEP
ncbi:MAG: alkaline phosphatase [Candidatus Hydrogenedentes bacterium]|nr:alkaline phosphatase [Candidatus Hydrogenedentota bacterium]